MTDEIDSADIRILEQIQRDCSLSTSELADKIGLSQSPCWRRLQKLRDEGYIRQQVALVDRSKFAPSLFIFATVKVGTLSDELRDDLMRKIELTPEIMECYSIFGERDLMIKVIASSMEWYQKFVFRTILKLPGVIDINSTATLAEIKYTTAIPVRGGLAQ